MTRRLALVIFFIGSLAAGFVRSQTPGALTADALKGLEFRTLGPGLARR